MSLEPNEDSWSYDSTRLIFKIVFFIGDLLGLCSFALLLTWICKYASGFNWTTVGGLENTHILFMSFFVIYLQGNASIVYRLMPTKPKYYTKLVHATLHATVCVGLTFGLVAIIEHHRLAKDPNFTTLHSWLGLTTVTVYYLQFFFGFFTYLYPSATSSFKVSSLPVHKVVGRSLFLFAVTSAVTGIMQEAGPDYSSLPTYAKMLNFAGIFAVVFVASFVYLLGDHIFRRRALPFPLGLPIGQSLYYGATSDSSPTAGPSAVRYEKVMF